jgi:tetratricopeptide (TPR) repeat protein
MPIRTFGTLTALSLLVLLVGITAVRSSGSTPVSPLELSQVKNFLQEHSLAATTQLVARRGIRFVPTTMIRREIEDSIPTFRKHATDYYQQLMKLQDALEKYQPKELLIAVAPFCGGVPDQAQNIQVAMVSQLPSLGVAERPFTISSVRLDKCITTESEADEVGQQKGVHIVVWGDWSRTNEIDTFMPKLRVTQPFGAIADLRNAGGREISFTYRLEPTQPLRAQVGSAARASTSDLIPLLIGLSFYHKKDYQRAARVLASVSRPSSDVYIYLAICSLALNESQAASQYLASAEKMGQASLEALHDAGTLEAQAGNFDKALEYLDKALQVDSHSYKTLNNKAIVLAMKETWKSEELDKNAEQNSEESCSKEAINTIKESREWGGPAYLPAVYNHAAILLNCAKYSGTALEGVQILRGEYLTRNPNDFEAWSACGTVYRVELNNYKDAEDCYLEAVRHKPSSQEYWGYLVNTLRVDPDCWTYDGRPIFFSTLVSLLPGSNLPEEQRLSHEETALSGLVLALASNGRLREAREAFGKLPVRISDLEECEQRLVYELAVGRIATGLPSDSEFMSHYSTTVYQHFFLVRDVAELSHRPSSLFLEYNELLQRAPSNVPTHLGKALLEYKMVLEKSSVAEDHKSFVERELIPALQTTLGVTTNQNLRRHLRDCISEARN